ncbi:MAG: hypothetical protein JNJ77_12230 [Planctomycetia bacterium]|nr:hypothetical protein [Planctomycetia bacterium]
MRNFFTILLGLCCSAGCTWQANSSSHAVEVNPLNYGSDKPVVQPSNMIGYIDGQPQDMRRK